MLTVPTTLALRIGRGHLLHCGSYTPNVGRTTVSCLEHLLHKLVVNVSFVSQKKN